MSFADNSLFELADRLQRGLDKVTGEALRARLETSLLPIVRVALRGIGHPHLVRWAQEEARPGGLPPRALAARLCDRLMERLYPVGARETVVGV